MQLRRFTSGFVEKGKRDPDAAFPKFTCKDASRRGAPAVIASAAKQSILSLRGKMDCFASLAMTAGALDCGACHRARVRATRWLAMTVPSA